MIPRFLILPLILALAAPVAAYEGGGRGGGMGGSGAVAGLSNRVTKQVVRILRRDFGGCQRLEEVYRYDCYRQTYRLAVREIVGMPAYRPARKALEGVEETLARIVARNADPTKPPKRRLFQTYRAIAPAAVPKAKADLTRALEEAETQLLRSRPQGERHFASIAEAVNSNKVLLRSALRLIRGRVLALLQ